MMLFKPELIEKIVQGKKTQTRRIVKDNEVYIRATPTDDKNSPIVKVMSSPFEVKWQVGKDYAVQPSRGKKGVWYCCVCEKTVSQKGCDYCMSTIQPLRINIIEIRKERLLDISQTEAMKEGFEAKGEESAKANFYHYVVKLYKKEKLENLWNPKVWILDFKVLTDWCENDK